MNYTEILAQDVTEGMRVLVETGPGSEEWPVVREVVDNEDGTYAFDMTILGMVDGWRTDEVVCVRS